MSLSFRIGLLPIFILISSHCFAQRDVFDQSLEAIKKVNGLLVDCIASFLEFPESHNNTVKVYDQILEIKTAVKDQKFDPSAYENPQAIWSNPKVQRYYKQVEEIQILTLIFEELLRTFKGYGSGGLTQEQITLINPLFREMGWKITLLDVDCKDAYFYEYEYKSFKMMFVKNTLPPADYRNQIYNGIQVEFTYHNGLGGMYAVQGGLYRMIQYTDDKNPNYGKVIKATSRRM